MTPHVPAGNDSDLFLDDEWFARQLELRVELLIARLHAASWRCRVRELEEQLAPESPLRSRASKK